MSQSSVTTFLVILLSLAATPVSLKAQQPDHSKHAGFDAQGGIYVSSGNGKLIRMASTSHCSEIRIAKDDQTIGCRVMRDEQPGNIASSRQLEIYLKGGDKQIIEPGSPIMDWHFCNGGRQVVVHSETRAGQGVYELYDSATARLLEKLAAPSDESLLPQWAKSQAQLQDESVPMSDALSEQRRIWIAKVLRQIETIQPGMRRKDLLKIFTTEGGISMRSERTYVSIECPYIKVTLRFKAANDKKEDEHPDDVIESISQPFLQWSMVD
jgi:hypothetical protein